jgi:hypothetical protein
MPAGAGRDAKARDRLAITIVSLSLLGIALASTVALWFASSQDKPEMARLVFASVLPLLGTWVGTVLAFYFARENLQAATDSTSQLIRRLNPDTPVRLVMVPREQFMAYELGNGEAATGVRLAELYRKMTAASLSRIPILTSTSVVEYVVHKASIDRFAASREPPKDPFSLEETMEQLLADASLKELVTAMAFVGRDAILQDARRAMRDKPGCNDVFVTGSGRGDAPVIGWLTNTDLAAME